MSSRLFALDIGTRSVVGIILEAHNEHFHVIDILIKEHKERAMVDGQIHNVLYVADLIKEIKSELEHKYGPLSKVSVAAAGRALKTEQASSTINIKNRPIFTEEDIGRLELQAVQLAQAKLLSSKKDENISHYYCVGYSVLFYKLDGEEIGSLVDQQGDEATVEVIATFLPRVVVESLLAALKRAELEMEALTLEPIAAINVLIPPSMRRLNVALVDIGAGTSDIAITDKGTVVAYGMVPTAGDEVTEALSDHYLLDFPVAEAAKRQLSTEENVVIQDILGFEQTFPKEEVIQAIHPSVEALAQAIGGEVLRLNNQIPPKAVMLVGGGSLTPNLPSTLSKILKLPSNRVAVRGIDAIQNLTKEESIPATPELVTPIGIAIAARKAPIQYMSVSVNEQVVRLFELKEMTVADAFLSANLRANQLYGKPGQGMAITVNNQDILIPGGHGHPARILVNGENASTKTKIKNGDVISLIEGRNGDDAMATVRDIVDEALIKNVTVQDMQYTVEPIVKINNTLCSVDQVLKDRDSLLVETIETVEELLLHTKQADLLQKLNSFYLTVDGKPVFFPEYSSKLLLNGKPYKTTYPFKNGDAIIIEDSAVPTIEMIANKLNLMLEEKITVFFLHEALELKKIRTEILYNGEAVQASQMVSNGSSLSIVEKDTNRWIYQDIFRFSSWQLPQNFNGQFTILRNGQPSSFDEEIFGGDQLEIILTQ
ncbi:cell division protein FtsA [Ureibacillus aquaedulcis]|uniref:Pilus assembly protein PilM n=1 Tax=Ureibacillus aquaedulcis TaxID=3058421 RepID=A0ABT8GR39_9BACL|nr:cell division FtsA domain-containing protein [Ureibacillus sp. BA0131]MDN4493709.1 pilus assembly protein PilM [Ureibacillus sp. BA0131]